jgi:hypothetical protein
MTKRHGRAGASAARSSGSNGGRRALAVLGGMLVLALGIAGCSSTGDEGAWVRTEASPAAPVAAQPGTPAPAEPGADATPAVAPLEVAATGSLDAAEAAGLRWMREEEKLARDVYLALADLWDVRVFANIARSEQSHMDAVETLLDRYGLEDPVGANPAGVFSDPEIQGLYDALLARGRTSLVEALAVGATIEDLDIVDLRERATDVPDIARVYANLEMGSANHLRAFVTNLERRGASYAPAYLSQADFDAIVSSPRTRGQGEGQ